MTEMLARLMFQRWDNVVASPMGEDDQTILNFTPALPGRVRNVLKCASLAFAIGLAVLSLVPFSSSLQVGTALLLAGIGGWYGWGMGCYRIDTENRVLLDRGRKMPLTRVRAVWTRQTEKFTFFGSAPEVDQESLVQAMVKRMDPRLVHIWFEDGNKWVLNFSSSNVAERFYWWFTIANKQLMEKTFWRRVSEITGVE